METLTPDGQCRLLFPDLPANSRNAPTTRRRRNHMLVKTAEKKPRKNTPSE